MKLLEKCKGFEDLMNKHSKFGASDSEPRYHFRNALYCKIHKEENKIPQDAGSWELSSSMKGSDLVAEELSEALKSIIESIENSPYKEVKEVISWYGIEE